MTESSAQCKKRGTTHNPRYHYRSRTTDQSQRDKSTSHLDNQTPDEEQIRWKTSPDYDKLIITDLTLNETELSTADSPDRGSLLR